MSTCWQRSRERAWWWHVRIGPLSSGAVDSQLRRSARSEKLLLGSGCGSIGQCRRLDESSWHTPGRQSGMLAKMARIRTQPEKLNFW